LTGFQICRSSWCTCRIWHDNRLGKLLPCAWDSDAETHGRGLRTSITLWLVGKKTDAGVTICASANAGWPRSIDPSITATVTEGEPWLAAINGASPTNACSAFSGAVVVGVARIGAPAVVMAQLPNSRANPAEPD